MEPVKDQATGLGFRRRDALAGALMVALGVYAILRHPELHRAFKTAREVGPPEDRPPSRRDLGDAEVVG